MCLPAGDSSAPQVEVLSTLSLPSPVWKVEWNMFGATLGAATEENQVRRAHLERAQGGKGER